MTRRVRVVWLPAVAATLVVELSVHMVQLAGIRPWAIALDWHVFHAHHPLLFYVPFLLTLPVIGAASATWSRAHGGTAREAAFVALFPAFAALWLIIVATPFDLLVDVVVRRIHGTEHTFCGVAFMLVSMVLTPGLALSLGLPIAALLRRRPEPAA